MKKENSDTLGRKGFGIVLQLLGVIGLLTSLIIKKTSSGEDLIYLLYIFLGFSFILHAKDLEEIKNAKLMLEKALEKH